MSQSNLGDLPRIDANYIEALASLIKLLENHKRDSPTPSSCRLADYLLESLDAATRLLVEQSEGYGGNNVSPQQRKQRTSIEECRLTMDGNTVVILMNDSTARTLSKARGVLEIGEIIKDKDVELRDLQPEEVEGLIAVQDWAPGKLPRRINDISGALQEWQPHPSYWGRRQ